MMEIGEFLSSPQGLNQNKKTKKKLRKEKEISGGEGRAGTQEMSNHNRSLNERAIQNLILSLFPKRPHRNHFCYLLIR